MQRIADFIMSKKFIPVAIVLTAASFFMATRSIGNPGDENPKAKNQRILRNVGIMLEEGHFSPQTIDDDYSRKVYKEFIKGLDPDKSVLLKSDVEEFRKKYETSIDDEIRGSDLKSYYDVAERYKQRYEEVMNSYKKYLQKPFTFTLNDSIQMDPKLYDYAATKEERNELWQKRIKYMVLDKLVTAQEDREKNKGAKDFKYKADSTLEREARESVGKSLDRMFTTRKNKLNNDQLFSIFVNAITGTMDPHTDYMPPIDLRTFNEGIQGTFYGIGAQLREDDGKVKIGPLTTGAPAQKSGEISEGDEVIKVAQGEGEPVDVTGYDVTDVVKLIRGEKGTVVKLTLRKLDRSVKVVTLVREKISLDDAFVKSAIIEDNGKKYGYIYLPEFYVSVEDRNGPRCSKDVEAELEKFKKDSISGVIIDLRGNGGGSLYEVVQMAGLFISKGPICQVKTKGQQPKILYDTDERVQYDGPLVVMVDQTSASASEIFAAAIQDYKRGIVVGGKSTYGKGTVQRNIPVNPQAESLIFGNNKNEEDLGSVKLTLQKFYRINGEATQRKGVEPDVVLPNRLDNIKFMERDNDFALPYDAIPPASYSTWVSDFSLDSSIQYARTITGEDKNFREMKENLDWIDANADRSYSLNLKQYKADKTKETAVFKQIDTFLKINPPLEIVSALANKPALEASKEKADKAKDFMDRIAKDLYLKETVLILQSMVPGGAGYTKR